jgi:hypothetical protein
MKLLIGSLALLAGCTTAAPPPFEPAGPCRVDEAVRMRFAGVKFKMDMRDELERRTNSRIARVLRPDDMATMEERQDRLNIDLDDGGQIVGLRCG